MAKPHSPDPSILNLSVISYFFSFEALVDGVR